MIPWWVLIPVFFAGIAFGLIVTAVCAYDAIKHPGKKWWEDS